MSNDLLNETKDITLTDGKEGYSQRPGSNLCIIDPGS